MNGLHSPGSGRKTRLDHPNARNGALPATAGP